MQATVHVTALLNLCSPTAVCPTSQSATSLAVSTTCLARAWWQHTPTVPVSPYSLEQSLVRSTLVIVLIWRSVCFVVHLPWRPICAQGRRRLYRGTDRRRQHCYGTTGACMYVLHACVPRPAVQHLRWWREDSTDWRACLKRPNCLGVGNARPLRVCSSMRILAPPLFSPSRQAICTRPGKAWCAPCMVKLLPWNGQACCSAKAAAPSQYLGVKTSRRAQQFPRNKAP